MRSVRWLMVVLALVAVSCGGGDDAGSDNGNGNGNGGSSEGILPTDFSTSDLPSDFPDDLVVPGIIGGEVVDIAGLEVATFETSLSYDDAIEFYTDALGEPSFEGGDDDSRLGSWTNHGDWAVQVLDLNPTTVGVTRVPEE